MAKGRAIRRFQALVGLTGILALVVTYAVITGWNPLPAVANWLDSIRSLSEPAPAWRIEVGDQPDTAVVTQSAIIISSRGRVEARDPATGAQLWSRTVAWSGVAGSDQTSSDPGQDGSGGSVVILGRTGSGHGYDAVDPATGAVRWSVDSAIAAWTFTDLVVGMSCSGALSCTVTGRSPADGAVRWQAQVAGNGHPLSGANTPLSGMRPLGVVAGPRPAPPLLGFPLNDHIQVIDSKDGRRLHTYQGTQTTRVVVAGDRVVITTALWRDGNCRFSVDARDPDGDRQMWHLDGYDLHTSSGLGCAQRDDPSGAAGLLLATAPDNRAALIDADTGGVVYRAASGQQVLATDGRTVLLRAKDGKKVIAVDMRRGKQLWSRGVGSSATISLAGDVVLCSDPGDRRLAAVRAGDGTVLVDATSGATVLGAGPAGLIINIGRSVGLLRYASAAAG